jgi:hypothetical protein
MIRQLDPKAAASMRQKVLAYDIFHNKKPWEYASSVRCHFSPFHYVFKLWYRSHRNVGTGERFFSLPRRFEADYLEKETNPHQKEYIKAMQRILQKYGTQHTPLP